MDPNEMKASKWYECRNIHHGYVNFISISYFKDKLIRIFYII